MRIHLAGTTPAPPSAQMSDIRQRKSGTKAAVSTAGGRTEATKRNDDPFSLLEIGRIITFLFLSQALLSWFVTGKDFWWGHRPTYTKYDVVKAWLVSGFSILQVPSQLVDRRT